MKEKSNRLYEVRKGLGLTQLELSERLGIAKNYVYLMESGRKPLTQSVLEAAEQLYSTSKQSESTISPVKRIDELLLEVASLKADLKQANETIANLSKAMVDRDRGRAPAAHVLTAESGHDDCFKIGS